MIKKYEYRVFPETPKARVLLAIAFLGGLLVMGGYFAAVILSLELSPDPECPASDASCLDVQTQLRPTARSSCEGAGKRVCLVPLGRVSPELVERLVDYYQETYDLSVVVLTPASVPSNLVNAERQQVDAGALMGHMENLFPGAFGDSDVILIGLTPADLYDPTSHFRYVFGLRGALFNPKAVISTSRMDPETYHLRADEDRVFSRTRKLFTKYLGLFYYELPPSNDPKSPLYDRILSPRDLDQMREPLPVRTEP